MRINSIGYNLTSNGLNVYTKRTCSDNSEMFITSKLNMLYKQTLSNRNQYTSKRNLRKMLEGSKQGQNLDETI